MAGAEPAGDGKTAIMQSPFFKETEGKRGIPEAIFIENVEEAVGKGQDATVTVAKLQEVYNKYQYMQSTVTAQRASLKAKLPDINSALETVQHLKKKKEEAADGETTQYTYQLAENIWAKAEAAPTDSVCLWIGANCMLEYSLDEALELLETNKTNATSSVKNLDEDMAFLRDQITTTEVNIARTHNYGVKQREAERLKQEKAAELPAVGDAPASFAPAARTGGSYTWKQSNDDVEVSLPVPKGAAKGDIKVTILAESIKVEHAGKVLLEGQLAGKCGPNDSTWTMTGSRVEITLAKADAATWPSLFDSGA